jgi:hypothetical protein
MKHIWWLRAVVLSGAFVMVLCIGWVIVDYIELVKSYWEFQRVVHSSSSSMRDLFIAESLHNLLRLNCFAEGVGAVGGLIVLAIGIHGLSIIEERR